MGANHPNLETILTLSKAGYPPRQIAEKLDMDPGNVSTLLYYWRKKLPDLPRCGSGRPSHHPRVNLLVLPPPRYLAAEATRRACDPEDLARNLLTTIDDDNLYAAVLGGRPS